MLEQINQMVKRINERSHIIKDLSYRLGRNDAIKEIGREIFEYPIGSPEYRALNDLHAKMLGGDDGSV